MVKYVNTNHHSVFLRQNPPFHKNYGFTHNVTVNLTANGTFSQLTFTCSKSTVETLEKCVKKFQS